MNEVTMTFQTDVGTENNLKKLAEIKGVVVEDLINQICMEYVDRELLKMFDNITDKLKNRT